VNVNEVIGEQAIESRLVLADRCIHPAVGGRADGIGRRILSQETGESESE
jgi:hypothetical protein